MQSLSHNKLELHASLFRTAKGTANFPDEEEEEMSGYD